MWAILETGNQNLKLASWIESFRSRSRRHLEKSSSKCTRAARSWSAILHKCKTVKLGVLLQFSLSFEAYVEIDAVCRSSLYHRRTVDGFDRSNFRQIDYSSTMRVRIRLEVAQLKKSISIRPSFNFLNPTFSENVATWCLVVSRTKKRSFHILNVAPLLYKYPWYVGESRPLALGEPIVSDPSLPFPETSTLHQNHDHRIQYSSKSVKIESQNYHWDAEWPLGTRSVPLLFRSEFRRRFDSTDLRLHSNPNSSTEPHSRTSRGICNHTRNISDL